jgi:predicted DNA-binding protein
VFSAIEIELSMVERLKTLSAKTWLRKALSQPRGAGIDQIRANIEQIIKESLRMDHLLETRLDAHSSRLKRTSK